MNKYVLLLFAFLFSASAGLLAQATLSIQGTVKNSDGTAVANGKYSIKFSLYTTESGGTPVWTETQDAVSITGGVYSALLGASTPLNAAFDRTYYLGVAVDGGAEWIPRARLTSSPYALSLVGSSNVFPSSGAIGAGTTSPDPNTQLTVSGGTDFAKFLITAPGDKSANLWMRAGDKLGSLVQAGDGTTTLNSPGSINVVAAGRVHLYGSGGGLRAYTDEAGFIVQGRMYAGGDAIAGGNITSGGVITAGATFVTNNGDITSGGNTDLRLYRNSNLHILCRGDGWTEFKKGVNITGTVNQYFAQNFYALDPAGFARWTGGGSTLGVSILADGAVRGSWFITPSDYRIKKDLHKSSSVSDLATLMKLEVTDYRYVDSLTHGMAEVKGFIAQQVQKVFPEAVSTAQNSIPDIFAKPVSLQVNGAEATFLVSVEVNLAAGDRVRILQNGGQQKEYEVVRSTGKSFTVKEWDPAFSDAKDIFIYGREVNDFCQVDYDKIHTLNVSATQELARQVEALRKENAALKSDVDSLKAENSALKTAEARLEARLQAIEARLPNH